MNASAPESGSVSPGEIKLKLTNFLEDSGMNGKCLEGLQFKMESGSLRIGFIHFYFYSWFQAHMRAPLEEAMRHHFPDLSYEFDIPEILREQKTIKKDAKNRKKELPQNYGQTQEPFQDFICGEKNRSNLELLKKIASGNYGELKGLLIYGESGAGKSMLLELLAKHALRAGKNVFFSGLLEFLQKFQSGFFGNFWQNYEMLILDDFQEFMNQPSAAATLVKCWDQCSLHQEPKFQIFSFSGSPGENLARWPERLRTRLERMLWMELKRADLETKLKYIEHVNRSRRLKFSRSQIFSLVRQASGISALQGLLSKLIFLKDAGSNVPCAPELDQLLENNKAGQPEWRGIIERVAKRFHLKPEILVGTGRKAEYVLARQVAMFLCREQLGFSFNEIGEIFGGRDHSTVMHSVRKIQELQLIDTETHNLLQELAE